MVGEAEVQRLLALPVVAAASCDEFFDLHEVVDCWIVGLLDCWIVGLFDCLIVGLLDCWCHENNPTIQQF
jgi:hypothetical protein